MTTKFTNDDLKIALHQARGIDGCHADTEEALAACRKLEADGLVFEGPFKNLGGNPVFFGHDRDAGAVDEDGYFTPRILRGLTPG